MNIITETRTVYRAKCQRCSALSDVASYPESAIAGAVSAGWVVVIPNYSGGKDWKPCTLCPSCLAERERGSAP